MSTSTGMPNSQPSDSKDRQRASRVATVLRSAVHEVLDQRAPPNGAGDVSERIAALERQIATVARRLEELAEAADREPEASPPARSPPDPAVPAPREPSVYEAPRRRNRFAAVMHRRRCRCAVCQDDAPRRSKRELSRAGWTVIGRWGICPACGLQGWQLSQEGGLPFRRRHVSDG
jgi:hypothetical protein